MSVLLRRATGTIGRPSVWLVMVLGLDTAIAITGIVVTNGSGLLGLLAAGPLLACARCGGRATAPASGRIRWGRIASHYQSATKQALVGGDLYDIAMTQHGPRFIIGDVKGKGLDAVGRCAAVLAVFRELAFAESDLVQLAIKMDAQLSRDMAAEDFVTIILADFAPGEVRIVNCGHHPPAVLAAGSAELQLMTPVQPAPPLGLQPHPARQDIALRPGDRLL